MIDILFFLAVWTSGSLTHMLLPTFDFIHLTAFGTFLPFVTNSSPVRLKTVLPVKLPPTTLTIHLRSFKHGKIGTSLVLAKTGFAVLPDAVVLFGCFIIVSLFAVNTVVASVQESRNSGPGVKMVFHL